MNPPLARLRDLGSLNATHVNNRKCGGRKKGESPEEGAKRKYPAVDLNDGDRIRVGDTVMAVTIQQPKVQPDESAQVREELARLIFEVNAPKQKKAERFIEQQIRGLQRFNPSTVQRGRAPAAAQSSALIETHESEGAFREP